MTVVIDGTTGIDTIGANTVTSAKIVDGTIVAADLAQPLTLAAAQNASSGTTVDFTGIPSWATRITVILNQVSCTTTAVPMIQIGATTTPETSGYVSSAGSRSADTTSTAAFLLGTASSDLITYSGLVTMVRQQSLTWVMSAALNRSDGFIQVSSGVKAIASGTIGVVRLALNAAGSFDGSGSVNIMYE